MSSEHNDDEFDDVLIESTENVEQSKGENSMDEFSSEIPKDDSKEELEEVEQKEIEKDNSDNEKLEKMPVKTQDLESNIAEEKKDDQPIQEPIESEAKDISMNTDELAAESLINKSNPASTENELNDVVMETAESEKDVETKEDEEDSEEESVDNDEQEEYMISDENKVVFENLDRNWSPFSADNYPIQVKLTRLCFAAFGQVFQPATSFPYSNSTPATSSPPSKESQDNENHSSNQNVNTSQTDGGPWIPLQVIKLLFQEIIATSKHHQGSSEEQKDKVMVEMMDNLTKDHYFFQSWDCSINDDNGDLIIPCLKMSSKPYQDYSDYVHQYIDYDQDNFNGNFHSMMQNILKSHLETTSPQDSDNKTVLHQYALLHYPYHAIMANKKKRKKKGWIRKIADLLKNQDFGKDRMKLRGMLSAVKVHVHDCELLVTSIKDTESKETQMHTMLFAYEMIAKECRSGLEAVETLLEKKYKKEDEAKKKEDEKEMLNLASSMDDEDIDEVRVAVANSLHTLGYSLSKTFGYNVTAPVVNSTDEVSACIKQQDIQYYQEALLLFSLLRPDPDVNMAQAETLYCLGNCYAYQKYISFPISKEQVSAPLSHLNFLKYSPNSESEAPTLLNTKAMKCYDQSFYLRRTQKGNDHPIVANSIHAIGVLYFEIQNWSHAVGCFMESLRISRLAGQDSDMNNDLHIADTQEWIGYCERELGKHQSALTHLNEALVLRTLHLGKRHPETAALIYKTGIVHDDLGEMQLSMTKYKEALDMFRQFEMKRDIERTLECIGKVHIHFQQWDEALECLLESTDMQYARLSDEIPWLQDVTQEDEEARTLPLPMFHNRDNRAGGSNRVLVISTSLDPGLSAGLLRQRKLEDVEKLNKHVVLLDEVYDLLTKLRQAKYDDMARILYRKSKALIKLGQFQDAVTSLIGCKKACWLWEPTGCGLEVLVETRLNGMQARMGQHDIAIQGYRELLNRCDKEDQQMADILYCMGNSHSAIGEYNEALSCLQKCMRIRTDLGEMNVEIANVKHCLGVVYCNLRRYEKSLDFLQESHESFQESLGKEHIHIAHALYYIGQVYQSSEQIDLENAMKHYEESLELYRIHYSPDHIAIGHVMHSIGTIHDVKSDHPKAMLCFTDALRVYKLYNDGDHLGVATLMNSMGIVTACVRNQNDLAMTYFEAALKLRKKHLGMRHPAIADTIHNIGGVYAKQSQFEQSIQCYDEALDIRQEYYGAEHLVVAKTMNNLGIVYTRQNNFEEAMDLFKKVLMIRRMFLDPEDEEIATTLYNIGNIHSRTGEYDLAMVCYEEALRVRRLILGESHVSVANMLHNIGVILVDRKKYENAIAVLDEALQLKRIELGDDSLSFSYTLQKIGKIHEDTEDYTQAHLCYNEALSIQRNHLGPDHVNIASILLHIGNVHKKQENFDNALECFEEALHIREMRLGEDHEEVANVFFAMGQLYDCKEEIEGAMICYGNASRIMKKTRSSDDEERIKVTDALRKVIANHSKRNGTMAAFWDTIVVTGEYWLGVEQVLLDLFEVLQSYILEPTKNVVKASINKTMKEIESIASHGVVQIKESASFAALYNEGLCITE